MAKQSGKFHEETWDEEWGRGGDRKGNEFPLTIYRSEVIVHQLAIEFMKRHFHFPLLVIIFASLCLVDLFTERY